MAYVIVSPCIDVKDEACQTACPVECIEGGRMMYIQPDECINCEVCESVCPVQAIYADVDVPSHESDFIAVNAEFFGVGVPNWRSPGSADAHHKTHIGHQFVMRGRKKGSQHG